MGQIGGVRPECWGFWRDFNFYPKSNWDLLRAWERGMSGFERCQSRERKAKKIYARDEGL